MFSHHHVLTSFSFFTIRSLPVHLAHKQTLAIQLAYHNSPISPKHKTYIALMWEGKDLHRTLCSLWSCHFRQNPRHCCGCRCRYFHLPWCGLHNQMGRQFLLLLHSNSCTHRYFWISGVPVLCLLISIPFSSSLCYLAPMAPHHTQRPRLQTSL